MHHQFILYFSKTMSPAAKRWADLSAKQCRFVEDYVLENNASQAARNAGYAKSSAHTTAYRLLRNRKVLARIDELRADLATKHEATVNNVINRYRQIAMTDAPSLLVGSTTGGTRHRFKHPDELSEDERMAISEIRLKSEDGEQVFEYKLYNAKEALDSLGRVFGMFKDRVQVEERERVRNLFDEIAAHPENGNTIAMLDARRK